MKKYYIIRADGSSIFKLPYSEDFIFHCLIKLLDVTDETFRLLSFSDVSSEVSSIGSGPITCQYGAIDFCVWYDLLGSVSAME